MNTSQQRHRKAFKLFKNSKLPAARQIYEKICRQDKSDVNSLHMLGMINEQLGDHAGAETCFKSIIKLQPDSAPAYYNLAISLKAQHKLDEAIDYYRHAVRLQPNLAQAWSNLGMALLEQSRVDEAVKSLHEGLRYDTANATIMYNLGIAYEAHREPGEAMKYFKQALHIDPENADVLANTGRILEKQRHLEEARKIADKALYVDSTHPKATILRAKLDRQTNHLQRAQQQLEQLVTRQLLPTDYRDAYFELGLTLDRLGDYNRAFSAFEAAQKVSSDTADARLDCTSYINQVINMQDWFSRERTEKWITPAFNDDFPAPAFLLGFPRSGTTLTEKILTTHSQIISAGEQPFISNIVATLPAILDENSRYPDCLDHLTQSDIGKLRKHYWDQVKKLAGNEVTANIYLDKLPLNITNLGMIYRIFPDARIIVALRDPRDACLSCFMQTFQPNEAMICFTRLGNTVRQYQATMNLWLHYRATLNLQYMEFHYEDLIDDIEKTARELLTFLSASWEDQVLQYYSSNDPRYVETPSYEAITKPVYSHAVGRWRNYRDQMDYHLDKLQPFIDAFGYSP
jgi:tetratricopeptide (TPR) repeat protein